MKNSLGKPNKTGKLLYICVCSQWIFGEIVTRDVTRTSVLAFVSSVRSPLNSSSLIETIHYTLTIETIHYKLTVECRKLPRYSRMDTHRQKLDIWLTLNRLV